MGCVEGWGTPGTPPFNSILWILAREKKRRFFMRFFDYDFQFHLLDSCVHSVYTYKRELLRLFSIPCLDSRSIASASPMRDLAVFQFHFLDSRGLQRPWSLHRGFVTLFNSLLIESSIKAYWSFNFDCMEFQALLDLDSEVLGLLT